MANNFFEINDNGQMLYRKMPIKTGSNMFDDITNANLHMYCPTPTENDMKAETHARCIIDMKDAIKPNYMNMDENIYIHTCRSTSGTGVSGRNDEYTCIQTAKREGTPLVAPVASVETPIAQIQPITPPVQQVQIVQPPTQLQQVQPLVPQATQLQQVQPPVVQQPTQLQYPSMVPLPMPTVPLPKQDDFATLTPRINAESIEENRKKIAELAQMQQKITVPSFGFVSYT